MPHRLPPNGRHRNASGSVFPAIQPSGLPHCRMRRSRQPLLPRPSRRTGQRCSSRVRKQVQIGPAPSLPRRRGRARCPSATSGCAIPARSASIDAQGHRALADFDFNGWGGKYRYGRRPGYRRTARRDDRLPCRHVPLIFEGGAVDTDGTGLFVTTEQCLLNPNPQSRARSRRRSRRCFAGGHWASTTCCGWGDGLSNDHTDGHVDNLARFVSAGILAIPKATTDDDPNAAIYADAEARRALSASKLLMFHPLDAI